MRKTLERDLLAVVTQRGCGTNGDVEMKVMGRRAATVAMVSVGAVLVSYSPTVASPQGDDVEAIADAIASVVPDQRAVAMPDISAHGAALEMEDSAVAVRLDPRESLVLSSEDVQDVSVEMPSELDLETGEVASDGSIVYEGRHDGSSAAVQLLADGGVRIQTIIPDAEANAEFTYSWGDGVDLRLNPDGDVDVVSAHSQGVATSLVQIEAPWAVDANGESIPTEYKVNGNSLIQTVHVDAETEYPVVADPTFGHTYGIPTMYLNWSETVSAQDASYLAAICALAPAPMNVLCGLNIAILAKGASNAVNEGKCVKYLLGPGAVYGISYSC